MFAEPTPIPNKKYYATHHLIPHTLKMVCLESSRSGVYILLDIHFIFLKDMWCGTTVNTESMTGLDCASGC